MGAEVIDRLIFALDGDLSALKAVYAKAEADAGTTGTRIAENFNKPLKAAATQASVHTAAIGNALGGATAGAEKLGRHLEVSRREVFLLGAELASGNFTRSPLTIARISTELLSIHGPAILGALAIAAIPAAFIAAATIAESATQRMNRALISTGQASGQTLASLQNLAAELDRTSKLSVRGAEDALTILNAHGNIPAEAQGRIAAMVPGFSMLTGKSQNDAATELEKIFADPAKGAEQLYNDFKLTSFAEQRHIQELEAAGRHQEALNELIDKAAARFTKLDETSTSLGSIFESLTKRASDLWAGFGANLNRAISRTAGALNEGSPQDRIEFLRNQLAQPAMFPNAQNRLDAQAELSRLQSQTRPFAGPDSLAVMGAAQIGEDKKLKDRIAALPFTQRIQELQDQARIAAAPQNEREMLTARATAQRELERNNLNPQAAPFAQRTFSAEIAGATSEQASKAKDRLTDLEAEAKGLKAVADAYDKSTLAGQAQEIVEKANEVARKQGGVSATAEAAALQRVADLKTAQADSKRITNLNEESKGVDKVTAAYRESIAAGQQAEIRYKVEQDALKGLVDNVDAVAAAELAEAAIKNAPANAAKITNLREEAAAEERLAAAYRIGTAAGREAETLNQAHREALAAGPMTDDARKALEADIATQLRRTATARTGTAAGQKDTQLQEELALAQKEHDLRYADAELRAKEIADLQVVLELKRDGWTADMAGYDEELKKRTQLAESIAALHNETNDQTMWAGFRSGLTSTISAGIHGFKSLEDAAANFADQLVQMTLELYVIKPLLNALGGTSGSGPFNASINASGGGGIIGNFFAGNSGVNVDGLTGGAANIAAGEGAAGSAGFWSSIIDAAVAFAGVFDDGGTIGPGQWGIKSGMPEIIQGGMAGVSIRPLTAPLISQAIGHPPRATSGIYDQRPTSVGASPQGGDTHIYNFPGVVDRQTAITARSQFAAAVTRLGARGQRNS